MIPATLAFVVGLAVAAATTPVVMALARRFGVLDMPGPRKLHTQPMPLLGGTAIWVGLVAAVLVAAWLAGPGSSPALWGLSSFELTVTGLLATGLLVVGVLDDRGRLHHQVKLQVAMPLAALVLLALGFRATVLEGQATLAMPAAALVDGLPVTLPALAVRLGDWALTLVWVVGVIASFNILDHMDGLCPGLGSLAATGFATVALVNGAGPAVPAAAVAGAAAGFLVWNFKPARIFMGDGGALLLGFCSALLALRTEVMLGPVGWAPLVPLLVLIAPLFDTLLIMISRSRRGLVPFKAPGKDHAAHRLANSGLGDRRAVLTLYGATVLGTGIALLLPYLSAGVLAVAVASGLALVAGAVASLERMPYERQEHIPG